MKPLCLLLVLAGFLSPDSLVYGEDKPEAIVEKAIEAQGGAAKVAKLRTMRIKVEGTIDMIAVKLNVPFTLEDSWQMPGRYKTTTTLQLVGKNSTQTFVLDGDKGWAEVDGKVEDLPTEAIAELREQKYSEDLDRLGFLNEKGYELTRLDEVKINDKPAVGLLIKSKGHRDVKLYFDKETALLVKRESKLVEGSTEITQEVFFSDYHEKDGLKHYRKIAAHRDDKVVIEAKVTELEFVDKFEDKVFAKP
jgi:hypothetical protein